MANVRIVGEPVIPQEFLDLEARKQKVIDCQEVHDCRCKECDRRDFCTFLHDVLRDVRIAESSRKGR